jgi:hypothetical protein
LQIIEPGYGGATLMAIILAVAVYYYIDQSRKGNPPFLRRIPALDAIDELIGRATEMGKGVIYTVGMTSGFDPKYITGFLSGLSVLRYVARKCAEQNTPLHSVVGSNRGARSENVFLSDDAMRFGCMEAGKPEFFESGCKTWYYGTRTASGLGIAFRTVDFASAIFVGAISSEQTWPELFQTRGVVSFSGTLDYPHLPESVVMSDYFILASEVMEAGAFLSGDPITTASIAAEDVAKWIMIAIIVLGFIVLQGGSTVIKDLLLI